ncbi:MAG: hypothetical protein KDI60_07380 [Xanthomonadales bacterium]|nr:hypothetical protein [Xanthomonadales bacterium]MCB1611562.1 hypothetical protein [Xanthomonadales bacterium]
MKKLTATVGVALFQAATIPAALADEDFDRFLGSVYTYCDAVVLGQYWGEATEDAKGRIGRKLGWGDDDILVQEANQARSNGLQCSFADTEFTYDDAEVLAKYWKISVDEAKAGLTKKASRGETLLAKVKIGDARYAPPGVYYDDGPPGR